MENLTGLLGGPDSAERRHRSISLTFLLGPHLPARPCTFLCSHLTMEECSGPFYPCSVSSHFCRGVGRQQKGSALSTVATWLWRKLQGPFNLIPCLLTFSRRHKRQQKGPALSSIVIEESSGLLSLPHADLLLQRITGVSKRLCRSLTGSSVFPWWQKSRDLFNSPPTPHTHFLCPPGTCPQGWGELLNDRNRGGSTCTWPA